MPDVMNHIRALERRIAMLEGGAIPASTLYLGSGTEPDVRIVPRTGIGDPDDAARPSIWWNSSMNRWSLSVDGTLTNQDPRIVWRGRSTVTITGAVTGTSFTLAVDGLNKPFVLGSVILMHRRQLLVCSLTAATIDTGTDFSLDADGYTVTTAIAPGSTLFFVAGLLVG